MKVIVLWLDFAISLGSISFACVELIISVIRRRFGANCGNIKPQHGLDEYERQKQAMDQISDIMIRVILSQILNNLIQTILYDSLC